MKIHRVLIGALATVTALVAGSLYIHHRPGSENAAPPPKGTHHANVDADAEASGPEPSVIDDLFEEDLFRTAERFTPAVGDERSLAERAAAIQARTRVGLRELVASYESLQAGKAPKTESAGDLAKSIAFLYMHDGDFANAKLWVERALATLEDGSAHSDDRADLVALLGIIAMRRGELENCIACVGPSSCIFPIPHDARHAFPSGSREAIEHFTTYLESHPWDLRVRWLLNLAYMTLGEYPERVPRRFLISIERFRSEATIGRFTNVSTLAGLTSRGPGLAGGSVFDDFNGDRLPDLFATSIDADRGASLFINRGDGSFDDRSGAAGLDAQVYALNARAADFDNDGRLDVVLLRGGWEQAARLSLLRNTGTGFEDVTQRAGMDEPIATEAAEWGDFDNDGYVDLFVCGEYRPDGGDPRNLCRLYRNRGDGTFKDVAAEAGVLNDRYAKGAAWIDFDNDADQDLFVSNMSLPGPMPSRLYRNNADGTFSDVASKMGIAGAVHHFTCVAFDYDNDGWQDLLVSDYHDSLAQVAGWLIGLKLKSARHPFLYRNLEGRAFQDVSAQVGLDRPIAAMSLNIGDLDNDGWLDLHFGTGWMSYSGLTPDLTMLNEAGERFVDITESSGTGHLQKGHGVSFADWDSDGDQDFYVVLGGGYPGDKGYSALFQNPGERRGHYLKIKLVGTTSNRSALGAKIQVETLTDDGIRHLSRRTIGNNGSFGGNSLVQLIGLGAATRVEKLTVFWPVSNTTQTFRNLDADQWIEVTEGTANLREVNVEPAGIWALP